MPPHVERDQYPENFVCFCLSFFVEIIIVEIAWEYVKEVYFLFLF